MNYTDFEQTVSTDILARGKEYFTTNLVEGLYKDNGHWFANVQGSEVYEVAIKGIRSIKKWDCSCSYEHGPVCKHVIAVMYAIQAAKKNKRPTKKKSQVEVIFETVEPATLLRFFKKNLHLHKGLKQKLLTEFIQVLDTGNRDSYTLLIEEMVKNAGGRRRFIDYSSSKKLGKAFYKLLKQATAALQQKNYLDAFNICSAVILKIPETLDYADDSNGAIQDAYGTAVMLIDGLLESPAPPMFKDQVFEFVLNTFEKDKSSWDCNDDLLSILLEHDWDTAKMTQIQNTIQRVFDGLTGNNIAYNQAYYIDLLLFIAEKLNDLATVDRLTNKYIAFPRIRHRKIEMLMKEEAYEEAKEVAMEGIRIAEKIGHPGTVSQWKEILIDISHGEDDVDTERALLREAFFNRHDNISNYSRLKATYDPADWAAEREKIIKEVSAQKGKNIYGIESTIAQIYQEEELWERLLVLLQKPDTSIHLVLSFGHLLQQHYPSEMLQLYQPILIRQAASASDRSAYRKLAQNLHHMTKIEGGIPLVTKLLNLFRQQYAKRPAMIDELSRVL